MTVSWDRNADAHTAGYRLSYGTASGNYQWSLDAGNQTTASLNLTPGSVYYMQVTAYNSAYQYGPGSTEASIDLGTAAAPTAQIQAVLQSANVALVTWQTTNAASATINGNPVATSGSTTVSVTTTTTFTLVATGASGATARASTTVTLTTAAAPTAPVNLAGSVSGSRVSIGWQRPTGGGAPQTYLVYAGTSSGATNVANGVSVGNVLSASADLPRGRYYIRVRAANASGSSVDSNTVLLRVGRQLAKPGGFTVQWVGTTATLTWTAAAGATGEDVPSNYVLEAGTAPGQSDVASFGVGNTTSFSAEVTAGPYYVRVRATNDYGESDPTADLVLVAPGAPNAPSGLLATGVASNVDLRWTPPRGGIAPSGYVIEAGTAPGLSNIGRFPLGNVLSFSTVAPPGVYYVRVRATNARGAGEASNEIVVRR